MLRPGMPGMEFVLEINVLWEHVRTKKLRGKLTYPQARAKFLQEVAAALGIDTAGCDLQEPAERLVLFGKKSDQQLREYCMGSILYFGMRHLAIFEAIPGEEAFDALVRSYPHKPGTLDFIRLGHIKHHADMELTPAPATWIAHGYPMCVHQVESHGTYDSAWVLMISEARWHEMEAAFQRWF